jgi:outer membrane lipoprotein-sorting protein
MKKLLFCALAILFMIGCASSGNQAALDAHADAPATAKQLTGSEIKTTVIGRKHSSVTSTGYPFSQVLSADGTAQIQISSKSMQSGSWVITEDVICVAYQKYGKECSRVLTDGGSIWFVDSATNKTNNKFTVK